MFTLAKKLIAIISAKYPKLYLKKNLISLNLNLYLFSCGNIVSRFSINSEANASEFLEYRETNLEEKLPSYWSTAS